MKTQLELHDVQAHILRELLFKTSAKFSELNTKGLSSDHFTFHLNKLVEAGFIEKNEDATYTLTQIGKELANRFDTDTAKIERQPKISVALVSLKDDKYLIQLRLKQPYYGYYCFPSGKVRWGEELLETAARELDEETGLQGDLTFVGIKHKMDYDERQTLLDDKFFMVIKVTNTKGILKETFEGGENHWKTKEEIQNIDKKLHAVLDIINFVEKNENVPFSETKYKVKEF
jgi:ADP-ribose pyrophosphatase YjhB (NUDIX family)/predicted transcriptional regulator